MSVAVSEEQFAQVSEDITLCFQTFGDPGDQPLLMVMGLAGPMTWWPEGLCTQLAEDGFYVIRFDNRDVGRSSRATGRVSRQQIVASFFGASRYVGAAPYSIADMAGDAFGLLDHLGIERTNLCGMSMGGMIVQTMAVQHPERVLSLVSMMSTTGRRTVGWQHPSLISSLLSSRAGREGYIEGSADTWRKIGSPAYPARTDDLIRRAGETYDRGVSLSGITRQMVAVLTQPDRGPQLAKLAIPAAVIHGKADKMVHVSGGKETAARIPESELVLINGMGHDLPEPLWTTFADTIRRTAARATQLP